MAYFREKIAGWGLMCVIVPLAVYGYLLIVVVGIFGNPKRVRAGVRALDHFVNASVFDGYAWESLSSHAWRVRDQKQWAKIVVCMTDYFQKDHCYRAHKREQHILEVVLKRGLHNQTVGKSVGK